MKMKIVSYNFRSWGGDGDGINNFLYRIGPIFEKIQAEMPDIIGFQEIMPRQHTYLERLLTEYTLVGQFRDADFMGEGTYVALRKDRFQILGFNTFWLSPTPYVPASRFEDQSDCPRICNVVRVRHRENGLIFRVFNTHLDHVGEGARVKGIRCILDELVRLNAVAEFPFVLMGDFNALPGSETIRTCENFDAYPMKDVAAEITHTFHAFGRIPEEKKVKIDYIYMCKDFSDCVTAVGKWDEERNGCYLSDHYPIWAEIDI